MTIGHEGVEEQGSGDLEEFYRAYSRVVFAFLLTLCRDRDLAEDLLQETFVTATRALPTYRGGSPRAWLFAIARSRFLDAARRRLPAPVEEPPEMPVFDPDVAEREAVRLALARLPERQRSALVLRDQLDLPYTEVAAALGISLGATKILIHRARAAFRRAYAREGGRV